MDDGRVDGLGTDHGRRRGTGLGAVVLGPTGIQGASSPDLDPASEASMDQVSFLGEIPFSLGSFPIWTFSFFSFLLVGFPVYSFKNSSFNWW